MKCWCGSRLEFGFNHLACPKHGLKWHSEPRSNRPARTPADEDEWLLRLGIEPLDAGPKAEPPQLQLGPARVFIDGQEVGTASDVSVNLAARPREERDDVDMARGTDQSYVAVYWQEPTVEEVREIVRRNMREGYAAGAFVRAEMMELYERLKRLLGL